MAIGGYANCEIFFLLFLPHLAHIIEKSKYLESKVLCS